MDATTRLTREQDGVLRRLTFFERCGMRLSTEMRRLRLELRAQDHRTAVRDPWESSVTKAP